MTEETVREGAVIGIHFTLTNEQGLELGNTEGHAPMEFLHGAGNVVPGLERALTGRKPGDELEITVDPEDGYGTRQDEAVQDVPRSELPPDFEAEVGMQVTVQTPDGQQIAAWIAATEEEHVVLDYNHPLAGQRLTFAVKVVSVREATDDEQAHGHVHVGACGHGGDAGEA